MRFHLNWEFCRRFSISRWSIRIPGLRSLGSLILDIISPYCVAVFCKKNCRGTISRIASITVVAKDLLVLAIVRQASLCTFWSWFIALVCWIIFHETRLGSNNGFVNLNGNMGVWVQFLTNHLVTYPKVFCGLISNVRKGIKIVSNGLIVSL